jgi:polyvinyl alcohol dehydrogenase (cytochrome)
MRMVLLVLVAISVVARHAEAQGGGEAVYKQQCASCHEGGVPRAASRAALGRLAPDTIRFALTGGSMKTQGARLSPAELDAVVTFLASADPATTVARENRCTAAPAPLTGALAKPHWNGWGVDLSQTRYQPAAMAGLTAADVPRLQLKWAFGFPGVSQAYAQPTVVGDRVFVGSAGRKVYSLDSRTGCQHWVVDTDAPVRTAVTVAPTADGWSAYFGDQSAHVYAVDASTGKIRWKTELDPHQGAVVTGAPTLWEGRLFVALSSSEEGLGANPKYECCTFRGSVSAVDAATGKVIWKAYTIAEQPQPLRKNKVGVQRHGPSGAHIWSSPTIDPKNRAVYVTTGDNYSDPPTDTSDAFMAFDATTGKHLWTTQMTKGDAFTIDCDFPEAVRANCPEANGPDVDFGSSPILVTLSNGRRALVAGQKSGVVHAIDPDRQGAILWQRNVGKGGRLGGVQWGSAADTANVYVALSDVQPLPAKPNSPGAQPSLFGIPFTLDPKAGGGLFALKLETGEVAWQTPHPGCQDKPGCSPAQSAAVTAMPGIVFSGGLDGHLRAYSADNGRIVWDVDTLKAYDTVNGVKATGGSLDAAGAVVAGGMLFVNSGYAYLGSAPGNVLLAFSVDGK